MAEQSSLVAPQPLLMGLLLLIAAAPGRALDTPVSGVVTESGRPIVGAPVTVDAAQTLVTDQDGRFSGTLAAGDHPIAVALHGYRPAAHTVTVVQDRAVISDFALEPLLQIMSLSVPASLQQQETGRAQLVIKNNAAGPFSIDAIALSFLAADGRDRGADFTTAPDAANPRVIGPGATAALGVQITPAGSASLGSVTVRASVLAFDQSLGQNLLTNGSFEAGGAGSAPPWGFGMDNGALLPGTAASIFTGAALTGSHGAQIHVPVSNPGDARAYWSSTVVPLKPGTTYVLSGYLKTDSVQSAAGFGAALYIPVVHNSPGQQPNAAWITGTRDWRKEMVAFRTSDATDNGADHMDAFARAEIQQATGTAWFDNLALTEGAEDGSLTLTGGDQVFQVTQTPTPYVPPGGGYNPPGGGYYPGY